MPEAKSLVTVMRRHLMIGALAVALVALVYTALGWSPEKWPPPHGPKANDAHWKIGVATGMVALALLAAALSIGPIRRVRTGRPGPIHLPWRRTIGVWSAVIAALHVGFGSTIHADGWQLLGPFTHLWRSGGMTRVLGISLWAGLGAAVTLGLLAATSNTVSMRRLGPVRWKQTQRLTYAAFVLVAMHATGVQLWEGRAAFQLVLTGLLIWMVVGLQFLGFKATRSAAEDASRVAAE